MSKEQAKEIIIRALREQPDTDEIPTDINITDDYLELSYGDERVFIYYDNIGDIHFYKKAYYHVQVNDKDSHSKIDLEIANEQKAKAFIDALNSLMIGVK
ncbi:MAG: hypothetical protein HZC49_09455 [Nitrospirae bacterium]|nr:hypothetical protein [Nitrospirota bacterium]